jgi:hypothetical protein
MRFQSLIVLLFVLLASAAMNQALPGGYSPIKDLNDPHVIEIANFAVTEYDKQKRTDLKFQKVVKGESQVVEGTNYRLTISATHGSDPKPNSYEAIVYEKPLGHFKKLISFIAVNA